MHIDDLMGLLSHATKRFHRASESFVTGGLPFRVMDIEFEDTEKRIFEIPMIPFRWSPSFEGLETMLVDETPEKTICLCRVTGSVRLPKYSHKRNERVIIASGKVIDHIMQKTYFAGDIIDYSRDVIRDWEFIDCVLTIILTPPLEYNSQK